RHAFAGPVKCENPQRGVWGGPPPGWTRPAANAGAAAGDGGVRLESWVRGDMPDLAAFAIHFRPPVPAAPSTAAAAPTPSPGGSAPGATPAPAAPKSGCGSCGAGAGTEANAWAPLVALSVLALRRRRRR